MTSVEIGIIEDDLLIAESIFVTLQRIGYKPMAPVRNYQDALKMIKASPPDFLLIDIKLDGTLDGIDIAAEVNKQFRIPFIFLTANSDAGTIARAKEVKPLAYLLKPFNESDLYSTIEIAISNFNTEKKTRHPGNKMSNLVFVKQGDVFHKLNVTDIIYVESDNVYLNIYTAARTYLVRNKLEDFMNDYMDDGFIRIHRSYAINVSHLESINSLSVKVSGKDIPLTKNYKQDLLARINALK